MTTSIRQSTNIKTAKAEPHRSQKDLRIAVRRHDDRHSITRSPREDENPAYQSSPST